LAGLWFCGAVCQAQPHGVVYGVVRDAETQQPIEGVSVALSPYGLLPKDYGLFPSLHLDWTDISHAFQAKSDAAGRYRFEDLPAFRYCLTWRKDGYSAPLFDPSCQNTMLRTEGGREVEKDLTMQRAPSLSVRVLDDATGMPIDGMRVAVQFKYGPTDQQWAMCCWSRRVQPGLYKVPQPPPAKLYLMFNVDPAASPRDKAAATAYGISYFPGVATLAEAIPVEFAPGEARVLEVRLRRQAVLVAPEKSPVQSVPDLPQPATVKEVSPQVTVKGVALMDLSPGEPADGWAYLYFRGGDPTVRITGGQPFEFRIIPGGTGVGSNAAPGWIVSRITYGGQDVTDRNFQLDDRHTLVVTLSRKYGTVNGTIRDGVAPMDNAWVVLVPDPLVNRRLESIPWRNLDENGGYEFNLVPPGRYRVVTFYDDTLQLYRDLDAMRAHAKGYKEVVVGPKQTVSGVDFSRIH
jgi:hypothetical protein